MSSPTPTVVIIKVSLPTYTRSKYAIIAFTAVFSVFMLAGDSWLPLVAIPAIALPWLVLLRLAKVCVTFTPATISARGTFRVAEIDTVAVADIALCARPGVCYIRSADGGSVVVPISALGFEASRERREREHDLEMLQRLYRMTALRISGTNDTGTTAVNRVSSTVPLEWIRPAAREILLVAGVCLVGLVCFLW